MNQLENNIQDTQKLIDDALRMYAKKTDSFTARKLTDTPTDDLSVVNRRYVNSNGLVANRPNSSIATMGQKYFATDTNMLMIFNSSTLKWYNGVGSIIA